MAQDPQKPFVSDIVDSGYEQGRQDALKEVGAWLKENTSEASGLNLIVMSIVKGREAIHALCEGRIPR